MHHNSRITQCIFALSFLGAVAGFSSLLAPTPTKTKDTAIRDSVISGIVKTGTVAMTSTDTQYGRRGATAANAGIDTIDTSLTSYFDSVNPMRTISPITGILKSLIPGIGQIADNKSTPTVSTSSINVRENADESGGIDETTERVDVTAAEEEHDDDDEPNDEPKRGSLREPTLVAQVDHSRPDLIQASNEQMRQDGEILTTKTREEDDILSKTSFILILVGIFLFTFLLSLCLLWGSYLCTKNKMRT